MVWKFQTEPYGPTQRQGYRRGRGQQRKNHRSPLAGVEQSQARNGQIQVQ